MKHLKTILLLSVLLMSLQSSGQQDPNYAFYRYNMNLINPAFAGAGGTEIGLSLRSQWAGVEGAPETQGIFASHGFEGHVGLGISIINDRTFIENQTSLAMDFSYRVRTGRETLLYLGLKGAFNSYDANLAGLETYGGEVDPFLGAIEGGFSPNVGFGCLWRGDRYFISVSAPKLLSNERLSSKDEVVSLTNETMVFYFSGGYDMALGGNLHFRPSFLVRHLDAAPLLIDLTAILDVGERFELGGAYRVNEDFSGLFVFKLANDFRIGYAYEMSSSGPIEQQANGTHEIFFKVGL